MSRLETMASETSPRSPQGQGLPPEIIEQIVDYHGDVYESVGWFHLPSNWSKVLLACHQTSHLFRECALRHICRKAAINLYDPVRLNSLRALLDAPPLRMAPMGHFVKEAGIMITDPQAYAASCAAAFNPGKPRDYDSVVPESVVLPLLKAIREKTSLETVCIIGRGGGILPTQSWLSIPPKVCEAVEWLVQMPTVDRLYIADVVDVPASLLTESKHPRQIAMERVRFDVTNVAAPPSNAALAKLTALKLDRVPHFPCTLALPSLRRLLADNTSQTETDTCWAIIDRASETLEEIAVSDKDIYDRQTQISFAARHTLDAFPNLKVYCYAMHKHRWINEPLLPLTDAVLFLQTSKRQSNLETIILGLRLENAPFSKWHHRIEILANHPSWGILDGILTSAHFPGLTKVLVLVKLVFDSIWQIAQQGARAAIKHEEETAERRIWSAIMDSLSKSRWHSVPLEVKVSVTLTV